MERQSDQKLGHEAERERNHQKHAETGELLQRRRRIVFIRIVSIETALWPVFISVRSYSIPCAHIRFSISSDGEDMSLEA
jgi:hypothetical protein